MRACARGRVGLVGGCLGLCVCVGGCGCVCVCENKNTVFTGKFSD